MHPLIKLQSYNGTGSLDTFLTKFQCMASYLCWDEKDMFHYLCTSLEGAVGQVVWDICPQATTANIVHLLQARFGTQLQVEHSRQSCMLEGGLQESLSNSFSKTFVR